MENGFPDWVLMPRHLLARLSPQFGSWLRALRIAGALINLQDAVFWMAHLFCAIMVVATACSVWLRLLKWKQGDGWKI
jgi:hypothetical protein